MAIQIPMLSSSKEAPINIADETKPLVNSTELQDLISGDRLLARAKKLFEIAKLGEEEYNHPTRVIGSAGMFAHVPFRGIRRSHH
jgi:aminopeptidase Y